MNQVKLLNYKQILSLHHLSQAQKLLLQATVLQGQGAINAWDKWQSIVDLDRLDSGSDALLSRLYCNLMAHQIEHPHMARLKGIYKRHWYGNKLALNKLQAAVRVLQAEEVIPIILGETAIALNSSSESQPPIHNYSLLIRTEDRERAIATLQKHHWQFSSQAQDRGYEANFNDLMQDGQTTLSLQGQLFWAVPQDHTTKQLWKTAVSCRLGDIDVLRLNFTNAFLHLCLRAFYRSKTEQISFFVDAMTLLRQEEVDWIDLVTQAQKYQTILPLRNMLTVLNQLFDVSEPEWVLSALHQMPVGQKEFLRYQILPHRKRTILKSILYRTANASSLITR